MNGDYLQNPEPDRGYHAEVAMIDRSAGDAALLAQFLDERSERAFSELIERHGGMVVAVCRRILGGAAEVDDAAQATFLVLARKAESLRRSTSLAPWLHQVAWHIALKARTGMVRRKANEREAAHMQPLHTHEADDAQWSELAPLLDRELAALPERYRAPLILFHLEGRSLAETAAMLHLPVGTAGSTLSRGRELLRRRLKGAAGASEAVLLGGFASELARPGMSAAAIASLPKAALGATVGVSPPVAVLIDVGMRGLRLAKLKVIICVLIVAVAPIAGYPALALVLATTQALQEDVGAGLADANWQVRLARIKALSLRGGGLVSAERAAALADDEAWNVREAFIGALPDLQVPKTAALAAVARGLVDPTWNVRWVAAETAGTIGPAAIGVAPRLRELLADHAVAGAARWALQRISPEAELTPNAAVAARVAELSRILGSTWTVADVGHGVVLASAPGVSATDRQRTMDRCAATRLRFSWIVDSEQPLTRPVLVVLVDDLDQRRAALDTIGLRKLDQFDDAAHGGFVLSASPAYTGHLIMMALLREVVGWDGRGLEFSGTQMPMWLQDGLNCVAIGSDSEAEAREPATDMRLTALLGRMKRSGQYDGPMPEGIPKDEPGAALVSIRWLLALEEHAYVENCGAKHRYARDLASLLVDYLEASEALGPCYRKIRADLETHHSRLVRSWAMPEVAKHALEFATGMPLPELQRQVLDRAATPNSEEGGEADMMSEPQFDEKLEAPEVDHAPEF